MKNTSADNNKFTSKIPIPIIAIVFLISAPVLIPIACLASIKERAKLEKLAGSFTCSNCQAVIGKRALALADDQWKQRFAAETHPGHIPRMVKEIVAICPHCHQGYAYNSDIKTFVVKNAF